MLFDTFPYVVNAVLHKLPFDPIKDLLPVSQAINMPLILVVPADTPFKSVQELISYAKANPGKLNYGSYGAGGAAHLAAELLARDAGIDWVHVPYKGEHPPWRMCSLEDFLPTLRIQLLDSHISSRARSERLLRLGHSA